MSPRDMTTQDLSTAGISAPDWWQRLGGHHVVACGHGTRFPVGRRAMEALVEQMHRLAPVPVHPASVDVQEPEVRAVVRGLDPGRPGVIVPLLLSVGYHTRVDLAEAAREFPGERPLVVAAPLGPSSELARLQARRLAEAGWHAPEPVVMGAAGSSLRVGQEAAGAQRDRLARVLGTEVVLGHGAAARPTVAEAVRQVRAASPGGTPVSCSSYVLVPGDFHGRIRDAGADRVAQPLIDLDDGAGLRMLAGLALDRAVQALEAPERDAPEA